MLAFDLDGTLVDTREAVRAAYKWAGVDMPDWAWGRPWQEWLGGREDVHAWKNRAYPLALSKYARPLPLLEVAVRTQAPVLTGASFDAVRSIVGVFRVRLNVVLLSATMMDKAAWLKEHQPGTYVDDDLNTRRMIEEVTRWSAISPAEYLRSS